MRSVCKYGCPSASACQGACTRPEGRPAVHPVLRLGRITFDIAFAAFGVWLIVRLAVASVSPGAPW